MQLNLESWHVRLFFWALGIWDEFRNKDSRQIFVRKQTNLCHYVRVLLVWMPFVLSIHAALVAGIIWTFIILPINLFSITGYGWTIAVIIGLTVVVFAIVYFLKMLGWFLYLMRVARGKRLEVERKKRLEVERPDTGPGFWEVLKTWMKAKKARMCPIINFAIPKVEEASDA